MKFIKALLVLFLSAVTILNAQNRWQQKVNTKIEVSLDDVNNMLYAYEEFTYVNNSPDTLSYIYVHLWPNAYKNEYTPFAKQQDVNRNANFYYSKKEDRGYIDSLKFTVDDINATYYSTTDVPDIARLDLPVPLLPGKSMKVVTPFKVKIPKVFSRLGHTKQAYFISQWFPKPAVYDQKGWHAISYLDQGEFFSEYGTYDVSITLPQNYILMATGNCMDDAENNWLNEQAALPLPNDTLYKKGTPLSSLQLKTVHYHEDNVHDFAWFADKRWIVRKDTVFTPGTTNLVTTWAAFLPAYQSYWKNANSYLKETIKHYGNWVGPYPYKTIKAVLGDMRAGGGMEYPTVTIIDKSASKSQLQMVVVHEAGHNWFYGLLGSNERDHAWMDEGLNTFYEKKTTEDIKSKDTLKHKKPSKWNEELLCFENEATHKDQAIEQTAANFTKLNYGLDVYFKTNMMLKWLEKYMGTADFEKGMHEYFEKWHYHHPYPEDFRDCMQHNTTKQIDWFFSDLLTTDKKVDITIKKAKRNTDKTDITLINHTGITAPVLVNAYHNDSLISSVWSEPFNKSTHIIEPATNWTKLKIDEAIPDFKVSHSIYKSGLFHHSGLKFKFLFNANSSEKEQIFVAPSLGSNQYDGFMAGILFHNLTVPENKFRFAFTPMYSFGTQSLVGAGSFGYITYPETIFKEILYQIDAKSFHYDVQDFSAAGLGVIGSYNLRYIKIAPSVNFRFNEHNLNSPIARTLLLKMYYIEAPIYEATDNGGHQFSPSPTVNEYGLVRYMHKNNRVYNPFSYSAEGQYGSDFAKINVDGNLRIDYNARNKYLFVRAYAGKFFAISNDLAKISKYELNASYTGIDDYLYDGTFIGRSSSNQLGAQQISIQEGGFKIPVYNGAARSSDWMATINLKTTLPKTKLPIYLFFDAGVIPNANPSYTNASSSTLLYEGGIEVNLGSNFINVYIPIIMSSDFQNYLSNTYGNNNVFGRSISFKIQLQNINWLKLPTELLKTVE